MLMLAPAAAGAQTLSIRGFGEGEVFVFPQEALADPTRVIGHVLARAEVFYKPAPVIQFAGGLDFRANSHEQVESGWQLDYWDRGAQRPGLSVRRLSATYAKGRLTVDGGKQFVRWGKTDIVTPTDRFAPRDFLNVINGEFLAVTAVRAVIQLRDDSFDGVWTPRFTPSRTPLLDQRWSGIPPEAVQIPVVDGGGVMPSGDQFGFRWSHLGAIEYSLSYFDGFNHLPLIRSTVNVAPPAVVVTRLYPAIRTYGGDLTAPTPWFTIKGEAAFFESSSSDAPPDERGDDYVLFVVQLERQTGEWTFVGGYAGEIRIRSRSLLPFAPDRGLTHAILGRGAYTLDPNRSVALEGAARENGRGVYIRGEYSQAHGQHWRTTLAGAVIGGEEDDFLGQYRRNSYASVTLRYSY
jgi:hypothetical protein